MALETRHTGTLSDVIEHLDAARAAHSTAARNAKAPANERELGKADGIAETLAVLRAWDQPSARLGAPQPALRT